jgi:ABC-2 type transport system ATP-binding protein
MTTATAAAVATHELGKRFGKLWALQNCTISVPKESISALVGPNGSGKTTLLRLLMGLSSPSSGQAEVLGATPHQSPLFLSEVGFLAQDAPLYRRLSVQDHLDLGRHLNKRWGDEAARSRLSELQIPLNRPIATLSGGQRSQVALSLALAKQPQLLLLDEPVASLDPLARKDFLTSLALAVSNGGLSVILSSHSLHDVEQMCDHVILLANAQTQLCGDIGEIVETHRMVIGPRRNFAEKIGNATVITFSQSELQSRALVRIDGPFLNPNWQVYEVSLEDIVLAYMRQTGAGQSSLRSTLSSAS